MKKIKSDKQLRSKKKQLLKRQKELESLIHANWIEFKYSLTPKNVAGEILTKAFHQTKEEGNNALADNVGEVTAVITKIAVEKIEEKFSEWLKSRE